MDRLPEKEKAAISLFYFEDRSIKEIAAILGIPQGTVKYHLSDGPHPSETAYTVMNEIDEFLRANKPAVKDDPTFLLETRRRLEAVEGIKAEVDRQRSRGRLALVFALAIGLAVGVLATAIAFLYPADAASAGQGLWDSIRLFLTTWKQYLLLPVAILAIAFGLVLSKGGRSAVRL